MKASSRAITITASLWLLMGATGATEAPETQAVGAKAAAALKGNLMAALGKALAEGGVPEAIRVCARDAMELTEESGKVDAAILSIERRTDRWRNPGNRADEVDLKAINAFREDPRLQEWSQAEAEGILRYYQPLRIAAACIQCHGQRDEFPAEVVKLLKKNYPEDRAIGYKEGELRGVIRVRLKE